MTLQEKISQEFSERFNPERYWQGDEKKTEEILEFILSKCKEVAQEAITMTLDSLKIIADSKTHTEKIDNWLKTNFPNKE